MNYKRIVRRCLAKKLDKRYQSIKDVAIELDEIRQELKGAADGESSVQPALERLPGPQGKQSEVLFEHGSLVVRLYAPHGSDQQTPHSRDEVYVVARGSGEFVCSGTRQSFGPNEVLFAAAGLSIVLKTSLMTSPSGPSSTDRKAANQNRMSANQLTEQVRGKSQP